MAASGPSTGIARTFGIRWWGHAAVTITLDGRTLVIDPILRRRIGFLHWVGYRPPAAEVRSADLVLLSHLHHDHTDLPSLRRFGPSTTVVAPDGSAALLRGRVAGRVVELAVGAEWSSGPLTVLAVPANHVGDRRGGPSAPALGYLIRGTRTVYVAGDTDLFAGMGSVAEGAGASGLDLALLPVGGWGLTLGAGHLDPERAASALELLRPRFVVPVHWGQLRIPLLWRTRPDRYVTPGRRFATLAGGAAPRTRVLLPTPGEQVWLG